LGDIKASNWDRSGAEQDYRSAIALSPNNAQAHSDLCYLLGETGRTDEAVRECKTAQELDPSQEYLSLALYLFRHDYDGAISIATIALQSDPDIAYLHQELFRFYAAKGMYKESVQELETTVTSIGFPKTADRIRLAFTASGYQGAMQQWAKELEILTATKQLYAPVNLALAYAMLGEKDKAFYWLEQGYAKHDGLDMNLEEVATDPLFAPLRDDPRYRDLLRRMGLPP
jgi:tetratricopeptide (TPR) repeat protein